MKNTRVKIQKWTDIQDEIRKINLSLAAAIDESGLGTTCDFIRISYGYGDLIMHKGDLQIPLPDGKMVPISDPQIPSSIKNSLSPIPLGLLLNKSAESFYETNESSITRKVLSAQMLYMGDFIGIDNLLDQSIHNNQLITDEQNISSGARTLFMLPKLTDERSHYKLQNYFKIDVHRPNNIWEHYPIFKEIANSSVAEESWTTEILFFSNSWWTKKNQINTHGIKQVLFQEAWRQSLHSRRIMSAELTWDFLVNLNDRKFKKQKLIILHTIKHLLAIQQGAYLGYAPAVNNDTAPIDLIKKAYIDAYKIKSYPTIMEPTYLKTNNDHVYYSLHIPFLLNNEPRGIYEKSLPLDFHELISLMHTLNFPDSIKEKFSFFHFNAYPALGVHDIQELIEIDQNFFPNKNSFQHLNFAYSSHFFKGCIKISF